MQKIFVTSDIWFNRPNENFSTTNEYNNLIIENWNKTVSKKDVVYILGGLGISDMFSLVVKLNGEIHILNNCFTNDDKLFYDILKDNVERSIDVNLTNKIIFEDAQILTIPELDTFLSYFPLETWGGDMTGTFLFHGYNSNSDLINNKISCKIEDWKYKPILISEVKSNLFKFKKNL